MIFVHDVVDENGDVYSVNLLQVTTVRRSEKYVYINTSDMGGFRCFKSDNPEFEANFSIAQEFIATLMFGQGETDEQR